MCILLIYTLIPSGSLSSLYSVCTCCSGGDTIRQIQVQSGAHVELHRGAQPNPNEKLFNVRGTPQQVQVAQQLIRQKYENVPGAGDPPFGSPGYVCEREREVEGGRDGRLVQPLLYGER